MTERDEGCSGSSQAQYSRCESSKNPRASALTAEQNPDAVARQGKRSCGSLRHPQACCKPSQRASLPVVASIVRVVRCVVSHRETTSWRCRGVRGVSDSTHEPSYALFPHTRSGVVQYTVFRIYYYIIRCDHDSVTPHESVSERTRPTTTNTLC